MRDQPRLQEENNCLMLIGQISLESPSSKRLATMALAASVGWYGSQNTYFDLSAHTLEFGPQGISPPYLPAT